MDRLDTALRRILAKHGATGEVKWSSLTERTESLYRELVDCLCDHIENGGVRFRQMHCDRAHVRIPEPGEAPSTELDVQFKLCYQFLKHAFGIKFLPPAPLMSPHEILIRLDTHSSQRHKDELIDFTERLPTTLNRPDLDIRVTFINSKKWPRIQICDVMIGAAGSYGNKMHLRRQPGQKQINRKQKLRRDLAKYIYDKLRQIDHNQRASGGFNWFESTGKDGNWSSLLTHHFMNWKFRPKRYQMDRGWQNDHLDRQGMYVGPDIWPKIIEVSPGEDPAEY
jgi:hypothetical protein